MTEVEFIGCPLSPGSKFVSWASVATSVADVKLKHETLRCVGNSKYY